MQVCHSLQQLDHVGLDLSLRVILDCRQGLMKEIGRKNLLLSGDAPSF